MSTGSWLDEPLLVPPPPPLPPPLPVPLPVPLPPPLLVPLPLRDALCAGPAALSVTLTVADSLAAVEGVKVTLIVQLPPAASVLGEAGQVLVCAKSALLVPVIAMPLMVNAALPV